MNEEQKVKEKAKAMLDYFQTTYERDLFATRCQPPENMQRKSNKVLYDRMWGGSRQNMLHSVNKKNLGYPPTTEMLQDATSAGSSRSDAVAGRRGRRGAARGGAAGARHGLSTGRRSRKFRRLFIYGASMAFWHGSYPAAAVRTDAVLALAQFAEIFPISTVTGCAPPTAVARFHRAASRRLRSSSVVGSL